LKSKAAKKGGNENGEVYKNAMKKINIAFLDSF
jgi:hypothetical protein